jgi:hypothetical protein
VSAEGASTIAAAQAALLLLLQSRGAHLVTRPNPHATPLPLAHGQGQYACAIPWPPLLLRLSPPLCVSSRHAAQPPRRNTVQ